MPITTALSCLALLVVQTSETPSAPDSAPVLRPHVPIRLGDDARNAYDVPFFPGADYDPEVTTPAAVFGQPAGSRIASHGEVLRALQALEATSDRVVLGQYGTTYEGRPLVIALITSPENHARLEEAAAAARELHAGTLDADGWLARDLPAFAWMGYGIHGDETSATEAAAPFAYHLAAARGDEIERVLDRTVIVLDPCLNPDGRERIRSMVVQSSGFRANLDDGAMQRGRWPGGRGNHFLFDMNRDWMAGEAPETRARWQVLSRYPPMLFVDAHEMSGLDTFLFYPQADPRNRHLPKRLDFWQRALAEDAGRDFDRYGWGYYTREWADALYPGYSDAWGSLNGAIGMLYEQGRTIGAPLERDSGEVVSYRESVHGQLVASWANVRTFAETRDGIARDYAAHRARGATDLDGLDGDAFVVRPSGDVERDARFVRTLTLQGVRIERAEAAFEVPRGVDVLGNAFEARTFDAGTWVVRAEQPSGALVRTYLEFDPRLELGFLEEERARLERGQGSRVYDVSAWNLARQAGVDGAWVDLPDGLTLTPVDAVLEPRGPEPAALAGAYAWAAPAEDTRSVRFAAQAMELGVAVHVSDEPFAARVAAPGGGPAETVRFGRGSFLVRRHENVAPDVDARIAEAARTSGARVSPVLSGRSADGEGPDLGGQHFELLAAPRVALVTNDPVSPTEVGALWRAVDEELGLPVTLLDAQGWRRVDLDRYNVLVVPPGGGAFLDEQSGSIADWVEGGGTLVTVGSSAFALAVEDGELSGNRLRRDVLDELPRYAWRTSRERARTEVDLDALYGRGAAAPGAADDDAGDEADDAPGSGVDDEGADAADLDRWRRRFSPSGVILRGELDAESWITGGYAAAGELCVPFSGSRVLMSKTRPAVRLAPNDRVRLGGLLWPEARARVADSAWLTVETMGRGQVVSFAASPVYRGSWRGTQRLFLNAVVVGPGMVRGR
ncbi:MAG: M14 family zinc carboxypeptidase [Planctomycetota bacterium]